MTYIEREALLQQLMKKKAGVANIRYTEGFNDAIMRVRSMVSKATAADVAPVKHGKWVKNMLYDCSECGKVCPYDVSGDIFEFWTCNYCPNCGARMDLED